jgi:dCMP deaminase
MVTDRPSFLSIYMQFAKLLSHRSTCSRNQVGCVVVTSDYNRVLSIGYNGGARGVFNECLSSEPGKCGHLHAEINALIKLDYNDPSKKIMLVTVMPCFSCSVAIVNAGMSEVLYAQEYRLTEGVELLKRSGINVSRFPE